MKIVTPGTTPGGMRKLTQLTYVTSDKNQFEMSQISMVKMEYFYFLQFLLLLCELRVLKQENCHWPINE